MIESRARDRIPLSNMEDVPIIQLSKNSTLQFVTHSEKARKKVLNLTDLSEFLTRHRIIFVALLLTMLGILILSASIAHLSYGNDYSFSSVEKVFEVNPVTEYEISRDEKVSLVERENDDTDYELKTNKLGVRKRRERRAVETRLKNSKNSLETIILPRVETGRKVPREFETIRRDINAFSRGISSGHPNIEKRRTRDERSNVCKRNAEQCKILLDSMQSLLESTGKNVKEMNKELLSPLTKREGGFVDSKKYKTYLECIECDGKRNNIDGSNDGIVFVDKDVGHGRASRGNPAPNEIDDPRPGHVTGQAFGNEKNERIQNLRGEFKPGDVRAAREVLTGPSAIYPDARSWPRVTTGTKPNEDNSPTYPSGDTAKGPQPVFYGAPMTPYTYMPFTFCFNSPTSGSTGGAPLPPPGMSPPAYWPGILPPAYQYPYRYSFPPTGMAYETRPYVRPQNVQYPNGQFAANGWPIAAAPSAPAGFIAGFGGSPTGPGYSQYPYLCQRLSMPAFLYPSPPGVPGFQRTALETDEASDFHETSRLAQKPDFSEFIGSCAPNYRQCDDRSRCIPTRHWCDSRVDCPDASDELKCSCLDRISKNNNCDGYLDCPHGEDEMGCSGCPKESFNCQDWTRNPQYDRCIPLYQRCDGKKQCLNGKDEEDCSILTTSHGNNHDFFSVGYTIGYLHKNWQGRWYPVCTESVSWATDACARETGFRPREVPYIETKPILPGHERLSFVIETENEEVKVVPTCNRAIYVRCPAIPCGTRVLSAQVSDMNAQREDPMLGNPQNSTQQTNMTFVDITDGINEEIVGIMRVVGGTESRPKAWPFLAAIHKNGAFNCAGVIINDYWILTAAHCVDRFQSQYYEIHAGLLRRSSFSPMIQARRAAYIKIHPNYRSDILKDDLALIKLDKPLLFNRWVRPACMPMSAQLQESSGKKEPLPGTICTVVGWGALFESGPPTNHLRETAVPITRECKHPEDRNDASICAGLPQGGRDACQGDSGGPLMCNYPESQDQWYVAGIVSHGEGCGKPNEPGAYTKVPRFVEWIDLIIRSPESMSEKLLLEACPGFTCSRDVGKCIRASDRCNRIVNCLDGEDEMNCVYQSFGSREKTPFFGNDENLNIVGEAQNETGIDGPLLNPGTANVHEPAVAGGTNSSSASTASKNASAEIPKENQQDTITMTTTTTTTMAPAVITTIIQTTANVTTTTTETESTTELYKDLTHFTCLRLIQSLPIKSRCNRVIDCEDGTDESNCTCKEYLSSLNPKAICNGRVDCDDGSDEEDCNFCEADKFTCTRSGICISREKVCDHHIDCNNMEDELNCVTLTNGNYLIMDFDSLPHLNNEGIVTQWKNGTWYPLCLDSQRDNLGNESDEYCKKIGFGSYESFKTVQVPDGKINVRENTRNNVLPYEYPPYPEWVKNDSKTCTGLYVKCKPVPAANVSHLIVTNPSNDDFEYLWPWQASVYTDGVYHCPAVLLDRSWLLVTSRCRHNLDLSRNYTTVLMGMKAIYNYVNGPAQQIGVVDVIQGVNKLDAILLHLQSPINITRYVQPIFIEKSLSRPMKEDVCVAIGVDEKHQTKTTFLKPSLDCSFCQRCYKNGSDENCKNNSTTYWSGTVVCRGPDYWYPAAMFDNKDLICGFQSAQTLTSIDHGSSDLIAIMEKNVTRSDDQPDCDSVRCSLGKCLPWNKVCDGVDDCNDALDETIEYCEKRNKKCATSQGIECACKKTELRCASGQCVPKESFCDGKIDCSDASDEPINCTCADYFERTAPDRLCNNVRDCWDKSDESNCSCKDFSFKCSNNGSGTETCISQDFVCDGEFDCPNGEDEKTCRAIQQSLSDPRGSGQVLGRSFGVWHSECFASPIGTTKEASDICRSMGYNSGEPSRRDGPTSPYGPPIVPVRDQFYTIRINPKTWIMMRNNRPLTRLEVSRDVCHRAFIKCV